MRKLVNRFKKLKNERGLTLVELLAVIVILAIIAIIAFVFIGGIIENSKKDAHIANAQQIISAAKLHEATGGEKDFDEGMSVAKLIEENYLDEVLDPWTKTKYDGLENATVTKENNKFKLNNFNASGDCNITADELAINKGDRGDLCK